MNFIKNNTKNEKTKTEPSPKTKTSSAPLRNRGLLSAITPIGIEFNKNEFALGENYCRIYSVIKYPPEVSIGWLSRLTGIPGTIVSISVTPIDNADFSNTMSRTVSEYRAAAESTKDQLERSRKIKAADDAEKIMKQIDQDNGNASGFGLQIMVLSRDKEDFTDKCSRIESAANALGCRVRILSNLQKDAYMHLSATYPQQKIINDIIERPFLLSTFTGGYPYAENGFCDTEGYYLGKNSSGGIVLFDLWKRSTTRTNSNITLVGDSGMGKSTALKHLILSEAARGTKIIIIDPEGEYKEICLSEYIKGKWIDVAGGRGGVINPLQVRPAPRDDDEEEKGVKDQGVDLSGVGDLAIHLKTLDTFFSLYLPSLTDSHKALLEQVLIELYRQFGITWDTDVTKLKNAVYPTFTDLYNLIHGKKETDKSKFALYDELELLLSSAANGADRGLWNGQTTIDGNSSCICLDTKAVTSMGSRILSAQYFNVLSWCWQEMSKNKTERVMLIADECWMLIDPRCPQSLEFLRNAEKRARKYEGSVVVSTQQLVDFLDPQVKMYGQPVLDMPTIKLLFSLSGKGLEEAVEVFGLNTAQTELVGSKQRGAALMNIGAQKMKIQFSFSDERLAMFGKGGGR